MHAGACMNKLMTCRVYACQGLLREGVESVFSTLHAVPFRTVVYLLHFAREFCVEVLSGEYCVLVEVHSRIPGVHSARPQAVRQHRALIHECVYRRQVRELRVICV